MCEICDKKLGHQKIVALRVCGHVMCQKCCNEFVFESRSKSNKLSHNGEGKCPSCEKVVRSRTKGVIQMKESGSAFASHSKVEAKIYKPAFKS